MVDTLEYKIELQNPTLDRIALEFFNNTASGISNTDDLYVFQTPYQATYEVLTEFIVTGTIQGVAFTRTVNSSSTDTTTRDGVLNLLNSLNVGTWLLDDSTAQNIYKCYTSNVISNLTINEYTFLGIQTGAILSTQTGSLFITEL